MPVPGMLKGLVLAGWWLSLFLLEQRRPAVARPAGPDGRGGARRLLRNAGLWLIALAVAAAAAGPVTLAAVAVGWVVRPDWWSGPGSLVVDLVILDGWLYWWHRANHTWPILWRFHEVHHLDRFLDTTTALRFHFGELVLSALVRAPLIVLLGIPLSSVLVFDALVPAAAIFHHSNVRLPTGWERALSRVVVTPSIHWVHHHARRADTDSNYATILSVWDRWFGTHRATPRTADLELGVEGVGERSLTGLLVRPFIGRG